MKYEKIVPVLFSLVFPALFYTYYYPRMYNKVNHYTERGQDIDDKIDLLNAFFVFLVTWIMISVFTMVVLSPILLKKFKK